jgi:hypothetical protein
MVESDLLERREAIVKLLLMVQAGRRLPAEEVDRRLRIWKQG